MPHVPDTAPIQPAQAGQTVDMENQQIDKHPSPVNRRRGSRRGFRRSVALPDNCEPFYRCLRPGYGINRIALADLEGVIGEVATHLERKDTIMVFDCDIHNMGGEVRTNLYYRCNQDRLISVAAISASHLESTLRHYTDLGTIHLMVAGCGVFWIEGGIRQRGNPG